ALPLVAELRDRLLVTGGYEDGVVPEAGGASLFARDLALEHALHHELASVRRDGDDRRDHARAAVRLVAQARAETRRALPRRRPARRQRTGRAAERIALDPRVLAERPRVRRRRDPPRARLQPRVLLVRCSRLLHVDVDE